MVAGTGTVGAARGAEAVVETLERAIDADTDKREDHVAYAHACHQAVASFWLSYEAQSVEADKGRVIASNVLNADEVDVGSDGSDAAATHESRSDTSATLVECKKNPDHEPDAVCEPDDAGTPGAAQSPKSTKAPFGAGATLETLIAGGAADTDDVETTQAAAMKAALAAARAEIQAADDEPPPGSQSGLAARKAAVPSTKRPCRGSGEGHGNSPPSSSTKLERPPLFTCDLDVGSIGRGTPTSDVEEKLSSETRAKLKMLRRLNPGQSTDELLARITSQENGSNSRKAKKRWFSRK